jgi:uncharacterized protein YlzI (FlbEa/FlbD family)
MKTATFDSIVTLTRWHKLRVWNKPKPIQREFLVKIYLQDPTIIYVSEAIDAKGTILPDRCHLKYNGDTFTVRGSFQSVVDKIEALKNNRNKVGYTKT